MESSKIKSIKKDFESEITRIRKAWADADREYEIELKRCKEKPPVPRAPETGNRYVTVRLVRTDVRRSEVVYTWRLRDGLKRRGTKKVREIANKIFKGSHVIRVVGMDACEVEVVESAKSRLERLYARSENFYAEASALYGLMFSLEFLSRKRKTWKAYSKLAFKISRRLTASLPSRFQGGFIGTS